MLVSIKESANCVNSLLGDNKTKDPIQMAAVKTWYYVKNHVGILGISVYSMNASQSGSQLTQRYQCRKQALGYSSVILVTMAMTTFDQNATSAGFVPSNSAAGYWTDMASFDYRQERRSIC